MEIDNSASTDIAMPRPNLAIPISAILSSRPTITRRTLEKLHLHHTKTDQWSRQCVGWAKARNRYFGILEGHGVAPLPTLSAASVSKPRRVFQLVVPVEAHVLDDAIAHHDDAGFFGREMLMVGERRDVDIVAALPFELLRLLRPFPDELVLAVEFHVPMQVVARTFHHE